MHTKLIEKLREDAEHHIEVAQECDCNPIYTINFQHYLHCHEAIQMLNEDFEYIQKIRKEWQEDYALLDDVCRQQLSLERVLKKVINVLKYESTQEDKDAVLNDLKTLGINNE